MVVLRFVLVKGRLSVSNWSMKNSIFRPICPANSKPYTKFNVTQGKADKPVEKEKYKKGEGKRLVAYLCLEKVWPVALCPMADIQQPGRKTHSEQWVKGGTKGRLTLKQIGHGPTWNDRGQKIPKRMAADLTSSLDRKSSSLAMSPGHSPSCTENLLTRSSSTRARSTHCLTSSSSMLALLTTTATLQHTRTHTRRLVCLLSNDVVNCNIGAADYAEYVSKKKIS